MWSISQHGLRSMAAHTLPCREPSGTSGTPGSSGSSGTFGTSGTFWIFLELLELSGTSGTSGTFWNSTDLLELLELSGTFWNFWNFWSLGGNGRVAKQGKQPDLVNPHLPPHPCQAPSIRIISWFPITPWPYAGAKTPRTMRKPCLSHCMRSPGGFTNPYFCDT